ncbi:MAG: NAD(+)/NADH kinase [Thermodesulfobacteriota bacterium]
MKIRRVAIILKKDSSGPQLLCREVESWFAARGIATAVDRLTGDCDLLVILGGDGTLLHVADHASRFAIPVIGINLGGLGFLTEVAVEEWRSALETLLDGEVTVEDRMMLRARMHRQDEVSDWEHALNDVVLSKGNVDRLVRLGVWADANLVAAYRSDGLVFSTPTGSTAYNLSAGGPIVHPALEAVTVTPICPFMLESRPVLLPASARVQTRLLGGVADVKVIVDGRKMWQMEEGGTLEIGRAPKPLRLVCSPHKDYFEILRNKLNWGGRQTPAAD